MHRSMSRPEPRRKEKRSRDAESTHRRPGADRHSGPDDLSGAGGLSGASHRSRRASPSPRHRERSQSGRKHTTLDFVEHGTIPGEGQRNVICTPTRKPLPMKTVQPAPAMLTAPVEIVPTLQVMYDRIKGLWISDQELELVAATAHKWGPRRSYRTWRTYQETAIENRKKMRFVPPESKKTVYLGGCHQVGRRHQLPELSADIPSSKGDWMVDVDCERPILVFWDHLIREINNEIPEKEENPGKYEIPPVDADRLRWAWERYTQNGIPRMDSSGHWHSGTGRCPFLECEYDLTCYADEEIFARHLVEEHCKFCPRFFCGFEEHRASAVGCHAHGDANTPFYTARKHVMVDHLKHIHHESTTRAIRITDILAYGNKRTHAGLNEQPRAQGMSWYTNSNPQRLWISRPKYPDYLLAYPQHAGKVETGTIVSNKRASGDPVTSPQTKKCSASNYSEGRLPTKELQLPLKGRGRALLLAHHRAKQPNGLQRSTTPPLPPSETKEVRSVWMTKVPTPVGRRSPLSEDCSRPGDLEAEDQFGSAPMSGTETDAPTEQQEDQRVVVLDDTPAFTMTATPVVPLTKPLQDALRIKEDVWQRLPTAVKKRCTEEIETTLTSGIKFFMAGVTKMLGCQAEEISKRLDQAMKEEQLRISTPLELRIAALELELADEKARATTQNDKLAKTHRDEVQLLENEHEKTRCELTEEKRLRAEDKATYELEVVDNSKDMKGIIQAYSCSEDGLRERLRLLGDATKLAIKQRQEAEDQFTKVMVTFEKYYGVTTHSWLQMVELAPVPLIPLPGKDTNVVQLEQPLGFDDLKNDSVRDIVANVEAIMDRNTDVMDTSGAVLNTPPRLNNQDREFGKLEDYIEEDMTLDATPVLYHEDMLQECNVNPGMDFLELAPIGDDRVLD